MFEAGGRSGFVVKSLELAGIEQRRKREHLQGHAPAERNLLGLVHDSHPAASDLAEDPKIAQGAADDRALVLFRDFEPGTEAVRQCV